MWNEIISCLCAWAVAVWLLPRLNWRSWQARYSLATYLGVIVVATLRLPTVANWLNYVSGLMDVSRLLQYLTMIGLAQAWAQICFGIAPTENRARRWIFQLAPLTGLAVMGLWSFGAWSSPYPEAHLLRSNFSLSITMLAQWQVFATTLGIGLPTTVYCYAKETNPALRLRYSATVCMQMAAGVMTGTVIGIHAVMLLGGLPRDYVSSAINGLMLLTAGLYLISVFPARWYGALVGSVNHLRHLRWLHRLRQLELALAERLGQAPKPLGWREVIVSPDYVLYTLVIAILDARKRLHLSDCARARQFAVQLDLVAQSAPTYMELVQHLNRSTL